MAQISNIKYFPETVGSLFGQEGESLRLSVCLCIAGRGKAGKKGGKVQGEKLSLVGINH